LAKLLPSGVLRAGWTPAQKSTARRHMPRDFIERARATRGGTDCGGSDEIMREILGASFSL